ncbi:hypothetical protein [Methanosarcina sp. MSH10X1]|nr:hypothetical protein [Methanosarcina sp. MSH10X1]
MGDDPVRTVTGNTTIDENDNIGVFLRKQQIKVEKTQLTWKR